MIFLKSIIAFCLMLGATSLVAKIYLLAIGDDDRTEQKRLARKMVQQLAAKEAKG